ncbi:uncharacterized protein FRV6_02817 [Fusarium oxysporum]|uniref:JmjC domain-containing protein n=1 Tax=Fusarium oxysporum TaxID=5507 RepID=A0A2H3T1R4_FUSOX|nr:uncharacterized protein FRV6_02817 [Fusarium oxysporum]
MTPQEVCNEIELVFESRMKSQTRLTIESKHHANVLLKVGPPLSDSSTPIYGVTIPLRLVSLGKSVFEIILGDWGLGWSSLLFAGASCLFIIIAPDSTTAFEDAIKTAFGIKKATCSQFLRHLGIFPSLSFLRHHNIEFSLMQQRVGDVAIIFPGTYCYGIETGTSYSENISWATDDWDPAQVEYENCHSTCGAIDVIARPRKRRCNLRKSTVQSTTTDIHQVTGASWEISDLGPDTVSSLQLPEIEQDYEVNHGSISSQEPEVDQRPKRQRIINHPFELLPPEREFSRTPESTRILSQRTRHILTNNVPAPFTDGEGPEVSTDEGLHERVEKYLESSERKGSAEEKESVNEIRRYWARLRDQQAQRTRSLRDG